MVPEIYHDYFAASVGAVGALVGLLFVAISLAPEQTVREGAPPEKRALAANAFTALLNAFFVSMSALLPHANVGYTAVVVSAVGIITSFMLGWELFTHPARWQRLLLRAGLLLAGFLIYGFEFYCGVSLVRSPEATRYVGFIASLLMVLFALGLTRAWQLLGGRRFFASRRLLRRLPRENDPHHQARPVKSSHASGKQRR